MFPIQSPYHDVSCPTIAGVAAVLIDAFLVDRTLRMGYVQAFVDVCESYAFDI